MVYSHHKSVSKEISWLSVYSRLVVAVPAFQYISCFGNHKAVFFQTSSRLVCQLSKKNIWFSKREYPFSPLISQSTLSFSLSPIGSTQNTIVHSTKIIKLSPVTKSPRWQLATNQLNRLFGNVSEDCFKKANVLYLK